METAGKEQLEKFISLVEDIRICMLLTFDGNGQPQSRPMSTSKIEEDGTIWFFSNEFSAKVSEISKNNEVYLTYSSPSKNEYVGFSANAELVEDRAKIDELWNDTMKAWFPKGKDDPGLLLIKITPAEAEYWEGPSSKIRFALGVIKALVTGQTYKDGEHGHLKV